MMADYDAQAIADVLGLTFVDNGDRASARSDGPADEASGTKQAIAVLALSRQVFPSAPSPVLIERAVASGLLRASLRLVAERIAGNDDAIVSELEHSVTSATGDQWAKLSVPESERTERLARLFVQARRALGTEAEARDFLTTSHQELDDRSPVEAARTDLGARRVERLLQALEYGLAV